MKNLPGYIVNGMFLTAGLVIFVGILLRTTRNRLAKEKTVSATVINKQCYDRRVYRKAEAPYTKKEYVVTFLCGERKLHFNVSEYSYKHYKVNQEGILRYKGSNLLDFKA